MSSVNKVLLLKVPGNISGNKAWVDIKDNVLVPAAFL